MTRTLAPVSLLAAAFLLAACQSTTDRSGMLLQMAGEEAAGIPNKLDRLTRQLNIADTQLRTNRKADADRTLLLARDTLSAATEKNELDDFHRIAAWTSISQLARRADDRDLALKSSDLALAALNDVQPAAERPQYVLSLASELHELRGKDAAVELVNSGGAWAADIVEPNARRTALVAFTDRLLSYEAYENARTMLRRDPDPVWRTDTFLTLANTASGYFNMRYAATAGTAFLQSAQSEKNANTFNQAGYGKDVRFENVFKQQGN